MAGKSFISAETVSEWKAYFERRKTEGASTWRITSELAEEYGFCPHTIQFHIDEEFHKRRNLYWLNYQRHHPRNVKPSTRIFWRNYYRIRRYPDRYLALVFENNHEASLEAITNRLSELCEGVKFRPKTVENVLRRYQTAQREGRIRGPPLEELHHGYWYYGNFIEDTKNPNNF